MALGETRAAIRGDVVALGRGAEVAATLCDMAQMEAGRKAGKTPSIYNNSMQIRQR
jgi:hypothetical protein